MNILALALLIKDHVFSLTISFVKVPRTYNVARDATLLFFVETKKDPKQEERTYELENMIGTEL